MRKHYLLIKQGMNRASQLRFDIRVVALADVVGRAAKGREGFVYETRYPVMSDGVFPSAIHVLRLVCQTLCRSHDLIYIV